MRVAAELVVVAGHVERLVQGRMEEGDVQAFEVVLDVEGPVAGELELAVARRIVAEARRAAARPDASAMSAKKASNGAAGKSEANAWPAKAAKGTARQVVGRAGEVLRALEARHEGHAAGEIEAARVVAAADLLGPAGRAHQQVAAVGADVGEAAQLAGRVAREQQRLVEVAGQHLARRERAAARRRRRGRRATASCGRTRARASAHGRRGRGRRRSAGCAPVVTSGSTVKADSRSSLIVVRI